LRFERELQALGLLSGHPGIVTVFETGFTSDGRPYLTMAYVAEGTLADRIRTRGPIAWPEAVSILVRLAGALETAHRSKIVHRDIKPANVLLSRYGAQLSDFGIARIAGLHETRSGVITASVAHAAPEVLNGDRPTVSADIYSLGSTAYTMFLGRSPFERDSNASIVPLMVRIQTAAPPDLRAQGLPGDLADLLARSIAKDPSDRPRSAYEFAESLRDVMRANGQPVPELIIGADHVTGADATRVRTTVAPPPAAAFGGPTASVGDDERPARVAGDTHRNTVPNSPANVASPTTPPTTPATTPAVVPAPDDPPRRRGRLVVLLAALVLVAAGLVGVALAVRSGSDDTADDRSANTDPVPTSETTRSGTSDTSDTSGTSGTSDTGVPLVEPPDSPPLVTTTVTDPGTPVTIRSISGAPVETAAEPVSVPATDESQTSVAPVSDVPVCGPGSGLLPSGGEPVRVILDTGIGAGVDDLGALAVLHALADAGEADILAVMVSAGGDAAAGAAVDAINTYHGRPDLPIGVVSGPAPSEPPRYTAELAAGFPNDLVDAPASVDLYRQVLSGQPDGSVTIVSVGFMTNLADLLASPGDDTSPSTGDRLVDAKAARLVAMGGAYPESSALLDSPEFNFARDAPAAQRVANDWPTPIVFSGFEVGNSILTGAVLQTESPEQDPVREGYRL
ncbi:MAG: protein kinase, partial [Ilumatobacter sp.]